jgi:hypothetical protein
MPIVSRRLPPAASLSLFLSCLGRVAPDNIHCPDGQKVNRTMSQNPQSSVSMKALFGSAGFTEATRRNQDRTVDIYVDPVQAPELHRYAEVPVVHAHLMDGSEEPATERRVTAYALRTRIKIISRVQPGEGVAFRSKEATFVTNRREEQEFKDQCLALSTDLRNVEPTVVQSLLKPGEKITEDNAGLIHEAVLKALAEQFGNTADWEMIDVSQAQRQQRQFF